MLSNRNEIKQIVLHNSKSCVRINFNVNPFTKKEKYMKILRIVSSALIASSLTQSLSAQLITLDSPKHLDKLLAEKKPAVLDFYATWCGVCKRAEPMVMRLARQHADVNFIKIDGDQFPDKREKYGIRAFPTFVFLDTQGNEVHRVEGMDEKDMAAGLAKVRKPEMAMPEKEPMKTEKKPEPKPMPKPEKKAETEKKPEPKPMPKPEKKTEEKKSEPAKMTCPEPKSDVKTIPATQAHAMDKNLVELESMKQLEELKAKGMGMVLDIYTTWCQPCKMIKPIIESLSKEYTDVIFVTINAEKPGLEAINKKYSVEAYPWLIFFDKDGKQVDFHRGSADEMLLKSMLGKISSKKTNIIIMDEKDMMAKMQAEQKMKQPTEKTMKAGERAMSTRGKAMEKQPVQKTSKRATRRGMYRR